MDERDFRLFTSGFQEPFVSNEELGRRLGLSGTAVKQRLLRLSKEISFDGYRAIPAASVLGRVARGYFFRASPDDHGFVDRVLAAEDVVWVVEHHDDVVSVLTFEEGSGHPEALSHAAGRPPFVRADLRLMAESAPSGPLSSMDWRILRALVPYGRQSFEQLAKSTGLSRKTVASHARGLFAHRAYTLAPYLVEARSTGAILFHLIVFGRSPAAARRVQELLGNRGVPYAWLTRPSGVAFVCFSASAGAAFDLTQEASRLQDVENVVFNIPKRNAFAQERVLGWVDAELEKWTRAARRA